MLRSTMVERKDNLGITKRQPLWNELFLMIQFVSNRKKNEKEIYDIA